MKGLLSGWPVSCSGIQSYRTTYLPHLPPSRFHGHPAVITSTLWLGYHLLVCQDAAQSAITCAPWDLCTPVVPLSGLPLSNLYHIVRVFICVSSLDSTSSVGRLCLFRHYPLCLSQCLWRVLVSWLQYVLAELS